MLFGILIARKEISRSLQPKRREVLQRYLSICPYSFCWFSTFFLMMNCVVHHQHCYNCMQIQMLSIRKNMVTPLYGLTIFKLLCLKGILCIKRIFIYRQIAVVVRANFYLVILQTFIFSGYATRTVKSTGRLIDYLLTCNILHLCNYSNFLCLMCLKLIDNAVTVFR